MLWQADLPSRWKPTPPPSLRRGQTGRFVGTGLSVENLLQWQADVTTLISQIASLSNLPQHTAVDRDSGTPIFTFINNDPVLLALFQFPIKSAYGIHVVYNGVNTVMKDLGGGYQLDPIDLEALGA